MAGERVLDVSFRSGLWIVDFVGVDRRVDVAKMSLVGRSCCCCYETDFQLPEDGSLLCEV